MPAGGQPSMAGSAIIPALAVPPEQLASCHFLANFVLVPRQDNGGRGFMDYLVPLIKSEPPNSSLVHAYNACAYASLGNRVTSNGIDFADHALSEYTKALAATAVALKDPEMSKSDGALAAVLLLGFFEVSRHSRAPAKPPPPGGGLDQSADTPSCASSEHHGQANGDVRVGIPHRRRHPDGQGARP